MKHRVELAARSPTALFITAASLTDTGEDEVKGVPIVKDRWLAKRPRDHAKLGRKEAVALPSHYLGDILAKVAPLRPRLAAFFAGSLDLTTMGFLDKLFVLLVVGAAPGDGRNWQAIREWARALPTSMIDSSAATARTRRAPSRGQLSGRVKRLARRRRSASARDLRDPRPAQAAHDGLAPLIGDVERMFELANTRCLRATTLGASRRPRRRAR